MELKEFRPNDVVEVTIADCMTGDAVVRKVENDKLFIQWIFRSYCYPSQRSSDKDLNSLMEIDESMIKNGIVEKLELVQRLKGFHAYILTEDKIKTLKDNYESNKEDLHEVEQYILENGCTEDGLADAVESFEQGYNNALQFVFSTLGVDYL